MENKYCVPGLAYYCPYVQRCEEEGKSAVILIRRPLMPFNSKIKKHFNWNSREGERITCLLRRVICKDLSDLLEEDEFEFGTLRQYDVDRRRRRFLIGQRPLGKEETDQQPC